LLLVKSFGCGEAIEVTTAASMVDVSVVLPVFGMPKPKARFVTSLKQLHLLGASR